MKAESTGTPKVSIIVPNYNHKRYLKERMESILSQTFSDYELILLDDCSTDGSQDFLSSFKNDPHVSHIVLNEKNTGSPFLQWQKGIGLAKGEYIWIAESDDTADKDFLSVTVPLMDSDPEARICFTGSHFIDEESRNADHIYEKEFDPWTEDGSAHTFSSDFYLRNRMMSRNSVYNASMVLFRRENCLEGISPEFFRMRYCGDWLFWIEQIRKGRVIEVHSKLNNFRKHSASTTSKGASGGKAIAEIAFIKDQIHKQFPTARIAILKDKADLYYAVRHLQDAEQEKRQELLDMLEKRYGIRYMHYKTGRIIASVEKHLNMIAFYLYLAVLCAICFMHSNSLPDMQSLWLGQHGDKIVHFLMFLPFPILAYGAFCPATADTRKKSGVLLAIALCGLVIAACTELIQHLIGYRTGDIADFAADTAGLLTGAAATAAYIMIKSHQKRK